MVKAAPSMRALALLALASSTYHAAAWRSPPLSRAPLLSRVARPPSRRGAAPPSMMMSTIELLRTGGGGGDDSAAWETHKRSAIKNLLLQRALQTQLNYHREVLRRPTVLFLKRWFAAARRPPPVGCSLTHEACALPGPSFPFLTNNEKSPENELNLKTLAPPPRSAATV